MDTILTQADENSLQMMDMKAIVPGGRRSTSGNSTWEQTCIDKLVAKSQLNLFVSQQEETMSKGSGGGTKGGGSASKGSSGAGTKGSGGAAPTKASIDNRSNQLNPNNPTYASSRAKE